MLGWNVSANLISMFIWFGLDSSSETIQTEIYEIGKKHNFENLKFFFKLIYQVLLGQDQGPRLGSFIKLYGIKKTIKLIDEVLENV